MNPGPLDYNTSALNHSATLPPQSLHTASVEENQVHLSIDPPFILMANGVESWLVLCSNVMTVRVVP